MMQEVAMIVPRGTQTPKKKVFEYSGFIFYICYVLIHSNVSVSTSVVLAFEG